MAEAPAIAPAPAPVPVVDQSGALLMVPEQDAQQAFAAGARPAEADEIRQAAQEQAQAELRAKYGGEGFMGGARAAVGSLGADLAGVTRGLGAAAGVPTDQMVAGVAGAIGGEQGAADARARLGEFQQLHPLQSKRSELLGATLGSVLAPEAGVAGAGEGVAEGGAALLGKGFLGRTAVRGARGALEGASYMGTDALNEAALGDHDLTGEQLFAAMGKGALFGGALSAGGGALGDAGAGALKGGGRLLTKSLGGEGTSSIREALENQADEIFYRAAGGTQQMAKANERWFPDGTKGLGRIWRNEAPELVGKGSVGELTHEDLATAAEKGQEKYGQLLDHHLSKLDAAAAAKGVKLKASDVIEMWNREVIDPARGIGAENAVRRLEEFRDSMAKNWGVALDDTGAPLALRPHVPTGPRAADLASNEATIVDRKLGARAREHAQTARAAEREEQKAAADADKEFARRAAAEDAPQKYKPRPETDGEATAVMERTVVDRGMAKRMAAERDALKQAPGTPSVDGEATIFDRKAPRFEAEEKPVADPTITFRQLRDARIAADKVWAGNAIDPQLKGYKAEFFNARHVLEDRLLAAGDELAPEMGSGFRQGYEAAKRGYKAFKALEQATDRGGAAIANNRMLGITDHLVGGATAKIGALIGSAFGPLGTAVGGAVGGAAGAIANHVVRKRFNFVAPELLDKAASLFRAEKAAAAVDRQMTEGVQGFFQGPYRTRAALPASVDVVRPKKGETRADAHARVAAEITRLANNPREQAEHFANETGDLAHHAPKVAGAMAMTQARATQFLQSKLPPGHIDSRSLTPHLEKPRISDAERTQFARYLATIDDPSTVLDDMKAGRLTREQVDALQAVYPKMYADLRDKVAEQLVQLKEPLPYQKQIQLSQLFALPLVDPAYVADVQTTYGPAPASEDDQPGQMFAGTGKVPKVSGPLMTDAQQIEKGLGQ